MNQIIASVKNLRLRYSKTQINELLKNFDGKKVVISFDEWRGRPTRSQLGYYFAGIISEHHKHFGYTKDEFYAALIEHCGKLQVVNKKTGEVEYLPFTVSRRSKMQMVELIDNVVRFLAENGIVVQSPEEYYEKMANKTR